MARFNGMEIHTDSIKNKSIDRVLPILEEEQIFMCRQMLPRLKPGHLVLDVGTGSGVFAIWAAKQNCMVIAIDINDRALEMAKSNASRNDIKICDRMEDLTAGSICFLLKRFDRDFDLGLFDTIILAPPYNPTYPGITTATHAQAGEDGQECFNNQIALVPKMLKEGGVCIGNQMTTVKDSKLTFLSTISTSFENHCSLYFTRILPSDINSNTFLEQQYQNHLQSTKVKEYINRSTNSYDQLSLVYYEITKVRNDFNFIEFEHTQKLQASWADRISLHCEIVNNI